MEAIAAWWMEWRPVVGFCVAGAILAAWSLSVFKVLEGIVTDRKDE